LPSIEILLDGLTKKSRDAGTDAGTVVQWHGVALVDPRDRL